MFLPTLDLEREFLEYRKDTQKIFNKRKMFFSLSGYLNLRYDQNVVWSGSNLRMKTVCCCWYYYDKNGLRLRL